MCTYMKMVLDLKFKIEISPVVRSEWLKIKGYFLYSNWIIY